MEFPAYYEGVVVDRIEGQTIEVSECCGASVEPCASCGADTPVHTECVECRTMIERVGEERLLSQDELVRTHLARVEPTRVSYGTVADVSVCDLCGGKGEHAGVVGHYACSKCAGTGREG